MADKTIGDLDPITMPLTNEDQLEIENAGDGVSRRVNMRNLAGMARVSWARPAADPITAANSSYDSFDEPWQVEANVVAADGEMVLVRMFCAPSSAGDVVRGFGLRKNGTLAIKNTYYPGGRGNGAIMLEYLDEAPDDGVNTYEVVAASSTGTALHVYSGAPNNNFSYNGEEQAGPALLIAQVLVPLYDGTPPV